MNLPLTKIDANTGHGLADTTAGLPRLPALPRLGHLGQPAMPKAGWADRLIAAIVAVMAGGLLSVAASLTPDAQGFGTHQQLGLPPCSSMALTGRPCPTCGMTTAFAWFIRGDLVAALRTQMLGAVLAAATLLAALGGTVMAVTGVHFGPIVRRVFVERLEWLYLLIVLGVVSWALKISIS